MLDASQTRSLTTEKDFAHPIEAVWRAMTDSEWLAVWFFPNDVEPVVGHKFTIWSRPIERWDGEFKCQVLAVEPGSMLFQLVGRRRRAQGLWPIYRHDSYLDDLGAAEWRHAFRFYPGRHRRCPYGGRGL